MTIQNPKSKTCTERSRSIQNGSSFTGCLVISLLSAAFIVGGMVGGMLGGGLIWWALSPGQQIAQVADAPTPTVTSTPTAAIDPTATPLPTPTATLVFIPTPSPEDIVEQILPSVVTVVNIQTEYGYLNQPNDKRIVGSGIVVDERGYIVTNAHVIQSPQKLTVILSTGQELTATLVIQDITQDLAMLKIEAENLLPATWGDSNRVRRGQTVIAIGSALGDFPNSVTMGIVSGLDRALALNETILYGLIQTDAAINQGNSGGPLANLNGEIIGVNTFIIREDHDNGVAQGIGFAIPASSVKMLTTAWISQDSNQLQATTGANDDVTAPQPLPASQQ